ncbi:MAG: leucine--tRNA ligase [Candidatus Electryonea clarkiae]|nr:leucine--tRNA ligase [Candidatus Electryonea clarkiae]MDP8286726.1 leucine--tRNA ligase [Candidatus Electryonea clarkiae]
MITDKYPFSEIETKWQKYWREHRTNSVDLDDTSGKNQYILVMFSYPSSSKLHIGHWWNYGPTDTYARFKRMQGFKVFEPMGFDSFGLPAENYAIKVGTHPRLVTESSIEFIMEQLEAIGAMYDWDYKVVTSSPDYYRWTQWLFLKLHENNLAYQKEGLVNWCTSCQTVLANEQVTGEGNCERCGKDVIQRKMNQWYFRITKYANELLEGLEGLDWPKSTVKRQQNWIGRSEGTNIRFHLDTVPEEYIEVFTTRPDTIYGVTYIVLAPENDLVSRITTDSEREVVEEYIQLAARASEIDRTSLTREKTGVFTGAYVRHPFTDELVPIWIADYVLGSYGTGSVMAVPAHDQRDFEFAVKYSLPIQVVIRPVSDMLEAEDMRKAYEEPGMMIHSNDFNGLPSENGGKVVSKKLEQKGLGGPSITFRLRDWSISRQRYWGAPIPIIHCDTCGAVPVPEDQLPLILPDEVKDFRPRGTSPLGALEDWINTTCPKCGGAGKRDPDTMDTYVCSSFYHLRYLSADKNDKPFDMDRMKSWLPVNTYVGGSDHSTGHLIYFRFITRFLHEIGYSPVAEPAQRLIHQGLVKMGGFKMSKSSGNVVNPDIFVGRHGSDIFRMYMMFMGDYREGADWSDDGIYGIDRFVNRVWRLVKRFEDQEFAGGDPVEADYTESLYRTFHYTIKSVIEDLEDFSFNTAISRMMEFINSFYLWVGEKEDIDPNAARRLLRAFIRIMAPVAPHFSEEAWVLLGGTPSVFDQSLPGYDPKALKTNTITLVIQVNGKLRDRIEVPSDTDNAKLEEIAKNSDKIIPYLEQGKLLKTIIVPGKLVNMVIR